MPMLQSSSTFSALRLRAECTSNHRGIYRAAMSSEQCWAAAAVAGSSAVSVLLSWARTALTSRSPTPRATLKVLSSLSIEGIHSRDKRALKR